MRARLLLKELMQEVSSTHATEKAEKKVLKWFSITFY